MLSRQAQIISEIVGAYDHPVVRAYCRVRFEILNQRFLDEIGQYLPKCGRVLDIGCGFGLFSLYYARLHPQLQILGIDRNKERVERARLAAERLGIANVRYEVGDVTEYAFPSQFDGAYMLDIVHHVPRNEVHALLERVSDCLSPGSRL